LRSLLPRSKPSRWWAAQAPNQSLRLPGAAFWFFLLQRLVNGPGSLAQRTPVSIITSQPQTGGLAFAKTSDDELQDYLGRSGVEWDRLDEPARLAAENSWRGVYAHAFRGRPRLRYGHKADFEYEREPCTHYLIVPFSAGVAGLPMGLLCRRIDAYECRGPLVPLGTFCEEEFFVCPTDFAWAMIHTHEDHALGGPYFIRAEWLPGRRG